FALYTPLAREKPRQVIEGTKENGRAYGKCASGGRFLSVDPVTTDTSSGGGFNRYAYAANSPYKYIDPDGREEARTIEPTCIPGLCTTVGAPSRSSSGASGGGTSGTAVGSGASPSRPSPYDPGGQYEVNIMGDPVNPNYPGVGAAQGIVGGTLVAGLGLAGVEGGAFIASQVQGNAMRGMSNEVLKEIIKAEGGVAQLNAKGIFGTGLPGATSALALAQRAAPYSLPVGLQVRALQAYRVIAERSLNEVQSLRVKIIDQYLKIMGR
uniref:RHS repeat-associated core domain-containing protein n=1 Tax=Massilia sp. PWRC2 TaxID=2804626 RepID=UPI003CE9ACDE